MAGFTRDPRRSTLRPPKGSSGSLFSKGEGSNRHWNRGRVREPGRVSEGTVGSIRIVSAILIAAAVAGCEFGDNDLVGVECNGALKCGPNGDEPDPIQTCNEVYDAYDCLILDLAKASNEPDPMVFKAQIAQESAYRVLAISPDSPCGPEPGWTDPETKSFGLMQLTPACGWLRTARLPDGRPNMTEDMALPEWETSVFNPTLNIGDGVRAVSAMRTDMMEAFPGCTENDYTKMALGAFNSGGNSISGCNLMNVRATTYVSRLLSNHYFQLARNAKWPNRYQ
jgi:hypothetical protein